MFVFLTRSLLFKGGSGLLLHKVIKYKGATQAVLNGSCKAGLINVVIIFYPVNKYFLKWLIYFLFWANTHSLVKIVL